MTEGTVTTSTAVITTARATAPPIEPAIIGTKWEEDFLEGEALGLGVDETVGVGVHSSELSDNRTLLPMKNFNFGDDDPWLKHHL